MAPLLKPSGLHSIPLTKLLQNDITNLNWQNQNMPSSPTQEEHQPQNPKVKRKKQKSQKSSKRKKGQQIVVLLELNMKVCGNSNVLLLS